jgi:DNA-binding response OmpR family regulator
VRIAIADDDKDVQAYLADVLMQSGFACSVFNNGQELITALTRDTFDLLLVDWNMPYKSGIDVIYWAKENLKPLPPIVVMTSRSDSDDVASALDCGADDYMIKPECQRVIVARVRSALRRNTPVAATERFQAYGDFVFDRSTNSVQSRGDTIALTPKEFALADLFFQNDHRPLSRGYILQAVWNSVADLPTRTLDMHVSRVRAKLSLQPEHGYRLHTVFGFGYRLEQMAKQDAVP